MSWPNHARLCKPRELVAGSDPDHKTPAAHLRALSRASSLSDAKSERCRVNSVIISVSPESRASSDAKSERCPRNLTLGENLNASI